MTALPFALDTKDVLEPEPRVTLEEGAVFGVAAGAPAYDERAEPLITVAWLEEPPGVTLEDVVDEDLARLLSAPDSVLIDHERVVVGEVDAVRTFTLHRGPGGLPTASEQWRLLTAGRRWTVSALTALGDQPAWGPRLAAVAVSLRVP
jgi:hypothetical protein